jgi:hypothetical protein
MENNDRRQRQNTAPGYAGQQGLYNPAAHTSRPSLTGQSPTSAPSSASARSAYAYPSYGDSSAQFVGIQPTYSADFAPAEPQQQQHARPAGTYQQYGQSMMYNSGAAATTPTSPYDGSVAPYAGQPRHQSAAIEVLSSQFGVPQQYYNVAGDAAAGTAGAGAGGPTSAPGIAHQSQNVASYAQLGYTTQQSPREQQLQQPNYPGGMTDTGASSSASFGYAPQAGGAPQAGSEFDTAYNQYQTELKRTFQHVRDGRLADAATLLMNISEWLLGNAEALGEFAPLLPLLAGPRQSV